MGAYDNPRIIQPPNYTEIFMKNFAIGQATVEKAFAAKKAKKIAANKAKKAAAAESDSSASASDSDDEAPSVPKPKKKKNTYRK